MLINPVHTIEKITNWIHKFFEENGKNAHAVIGLSGGKDSAVAAALCVKAIGKEKVLGVLMPNGVQKDLEDAKKLAKILNIKCVTLNIENVTKSMKEMIISNEELKKITKSDELSQDAKINLVPRIRMTSLYAIAQMLPQGGRVVNTCNMSEDYVGYSTKYGDGAGDFAPLSQLLVEEIKQIGNELQLPQELINKTPSDGLSGKSDEEKLGFTYETLDKYILSGICEDEKTKKRIDELHAINLHKIKKIPTYIPDALDRKVSEK